MCFPREEKEDSCITEFLEEFLGTLMTAADATEPDRNLSTVFQLLPSKRRYPEYYQVSPEFIINIPFYTRTHCVISFS